MVEYPHPAGDVKHLAAVARPDPRALRALDEFPAETEGGHEVDLAAADVPSVQILDLFYGETFTLVYADELGHGRPSRYVRIPLVPGLLRGGEKR
ncbi:hypothetical protein GCM10009850_031050 [Nonomuraea monospora]|uniref:Uncharacterized protein n=1 Tax=Nonomuraea monospora TaxID=568818 RepID=A0ABN3CES3_9ACTN